MMIYEVCSDSDHCKMLTKQEFEERKNEILENNLPIPEFFYISNLASKKLGSYPLISQAKPQSLPLTVK